MLSSLLPMPDLSDDDQRQVRTWLAFWHQALRGRLQPPEVPLDLLARAAVADPSSYVRWNCLSVLDHAGDERHAAVFVEACADPVPRVRRHALHALSCTRCKTGSWCVDPIPVVCEVLRNDPSRKVRIAAVHALLARRDDPKVNDLLRQVAAEDHDTEVRRWAAWRGALAG